MNYNDILNEEYAKAIKDVANAKYHNTFHRGIFGYIANKGWEVVSYGDNTIDFYGKSRLFLFHATHFTTQREWTLSERVRIEFQNIVWDYIYQYPNYTRPQNYVEILVSKFDEYMEKKGKEFDVVPILEPYRTYREREREFDKYIVTETYYGYGAPQPIRKEFGNLDDAKKFAYEYADEKCKRGKERNDSTSRYYLFSPIDATKECPSKIYAYKTYEYDERAYYVYIENC